MWVEIVGSFGAGLLSLALFYRWRLRRSFGTHDATNEINIKGKVVLITGGNSGLGKECALEMAKRGARVIIASRDFALSKRVTEEIQKKYPKSEVTPMHLDLGSLDSIRQFVSDFQKKFPQVHTLINNAGVFTPLSKRMKTEDGFEFNFGVNHLGHFLLTNLLLDNLIRGSPSRIVIVTSMLSEKGNIDFDDLMLEKVDPNSKSITKFTAYGNSKLANILFAKELSRKLEGTRVHVYSLCPGWVKTELHRYMGMSWWNYLVAAPAAFMFMRSARQGVQTILHCALSKRVDGETGKLYRNCAPWVSKSQITNDMAERLWEESEKLVKLNND